MTVRTRRRLTRRLLGTGALAMGLVAAGAGVASAHVTVSAPGATPGGSDTVITFRVPNESTARTVGLKVRMPSETPIASVLVQPKPGWSATVSRSKLGSPIKTDDGEITEVISEIDWKVSAPSQGIGPGQFDEFVVLAGQLPDAASLTFKAIQSYSDGSTVSWIEEPAPDSSAAPEHPAPVLNLGGGSSSSGSATGGSSERASPGSQSGSASPSGFSSHAESGAAQPADAASKATAVTGIVLGALGVLLGLAALAVAARRRRV
ncbi:MAG: hypothetical protein QOI26_22 [Pseudonocardiales bacterium]|nr:hypothetical protein [Pseudonocardiales bacterium]